MPDLIAYLDARTRLPLPLRRLIGEERQLCTYYLVNGENFDGCTGREDLANAIGGGPEELARRFAKKVAFDSFSAVIERVADALATRNPDYAAGLDAETLRAFDPDGQR